MVVSPIVKLAKEGYPLGMKVMALIPLLLIPALVIAEDIQSHNGRYVFSQSSLVVKNNFLIDSKTGRMWQVELAADGELYMVPMFFHIGIDRLSAYPTGEQSFPHSFTPPEPSPPQ